MIYYIIRKILLIAIALCGVTFLTFSMTFLVPGDPAEMIAIAKYGISDISPEMVDEIRIAEGMDKPFLAQYLKWLGKVCSGDLGRSRITNCNVANEIVSRLPATIELAIVGLIISLLTGVPLGIISAVKQNTPVDYFCTGISLIGVSIPNFWLGLLLILFFGIYLNILPTFGYGTVKHFILPSFSIGISMAGITSRMTRSSMIDILNQQYITTAKAMGFKDKEILRKYALKNALIPLVTIAGIQFGYLLEGTVIIEKIFSWPGIGSLLIDSIFSRDFIITQGCVLYIALIFSLVNLLVDISYIYLDPRIKYNTNA